jgi:hypothetical protein
MIDVQKDILKFENLLRMANDTGQCREALAILTRWQWDGDLSPESRDDARRLVREFTGRFF